jgi:crotonobetainyl-CoA:carnitine CoA-transferase CaiB-like acyl-CoA transferase
MDVVAGQSRGQKRENEQIARVAKMKAEALQHRAEAAFGSVVMWTIRQTDYGAFGSLMKNKTFLQGITVLDLTRLLPGPACTMHLRRLGARVIKIEPPGEGDYARRMGLPPDAAPDAVSPFFSLLNEGKEVCTLDFQRPSDVNTFLEWVSTADIVLESFRPGVVDRLGIGFEACQRANSRIVFGSISGYGQTGEWAHKAGHDINYLALSGVLDQIGVRGGPPSLCNVQIADLLGGAMPAAMEVLAALLAAQRTGQAQRCDVSMTHYSFAANLVARHNVMLNGQAPERGNDWLTGAYACYNVYRTADDRYMAVGALEQKFWGVVCAALEISHLETLGHQSGTVGLRVKKEVQDVFLTKTREEWTQLFAQCDACVTPVLTADEAMQHSLFAA